jgi:hypothetical protein
MEGLTAKLEIETMISQVIDWSRRVMEGAEPSIMFDRNERSSNV